MRGRAHLGKAVLSTGMANSHPSTYKMLGCFLLNHSINFFFKFSITTTDYVGGKT